MAKSPITLVWKTCTGEMLRRILFIAAGVILAASYESPLIFTPWARPGAAPAGETVALAPPPPEKSRPQPAAFQPISSPSPAPVYVIGAPAAPARPLRRNLPPVANAQLLYMMGLTLDSLGHHRRAERFYQHVVHEAPHQSPLRAKAEHRLAH